MWIETIKLRDFRNYTTLEMKPHPGVNLLFGQNGCGKTNLLEAIHYCALGRSHRTSLDREVVRKGAQMGACGVELRRREGRSDIAVKLTPGEARKKQVFIDRKRADRLSELMGRVQCVIFSPEDLMLVKEGPAIRRRYADMMLSQLSPLYFTSLQQYQKALEQRTALLKEARKTGVTPHDLLDVFEDGMARPCEVIIPLRRQMIARIADIAQAKYASISGRAGETFRMTYESCLPDLASLSDPISIPDQIRHHLKRTRHDDLLRGSTTFGPHREDIALTLESREMKLYASQGQIRTASLCMKLSQLDLFRRETGETPILLLDDVMSELDLTRRGRLLDELHDIQTFVTCTDESDLSGSLDRRTYRVSLTADHTARLEETRAGEHVDMVEDNDEEPDFT